jgi:cell division protein DivIC
MKWFSIVKNKFVVATLAFVVWMLFFDERNLPLQLQRVGELKDLQAGKAHYLQENAQLKQALNDLANNPATLEKYAREKYLMKRDNEDIFPIEAPVAQ